MTPNSPVTGKQITAARAALAWTRDELADKSGLHPSSIRHYERRNRFERRAGANYGLRRITQACADAGVTFNTEPEPGLSISWSAIHGR
ncbi:MAG: XRE family transcriptional regulator [Alphaproteobacteria bacterium]|nr:XRE family transcriptional regulator [Alphaproteobacteria bacterium]